ncbi:MAG: hypothetical protein WBH77_05075 [Saccharofermentanales bacterium]
MESDNLDSFNPHNKQNNNIQDLENDQPSVQIRRVKISETNFDGPSEAPNVDTIQTSDVDFVNESDVDFVDESDVDFVDESDVDFVDESDVDFIDESDVDFVDESDVDFVNESDVDFVNESDVDFYQTSEFESPEIISEADLSQSEKPEYRIEQSNRNFYADKPDDSQIEIINEKSLESDLVGSNRKVVNDDTIIKEPAIRLDAETLKQYLKPVDKTKTPDSNQVQAKDKPWEIDRKNGSKVYELIGYTTLSKIHHGIKKENRQSLLKRVLITLMLFVIIFIILYVMNPIKDLVDFRRIIGIESMYGENYSKIQEPTDINNDPENNPENDKDSETDSETDSNSETE